MVNLWLPAAAAGMGIATTIALGRGLHPGGGGKRGSQELSMAIAVAVSLFTVCRGGEEVSINRLRRVTIGGSRNYQLQLSLLCKQFMPTHTQLTEPG